MTVKQMFEQHNEPEVVLIKFSGDEPKNFLALKRQYDNRIDLIDLGCGDTGSDLRDSSIDELRGMASDWLRCILSGCGAEEREEIEAEAAPQIAKI